MGSMPPTRLLPVTAVIVTSACFLTGPENQPPTVTITQPANQHVVDVGNVVEVVAEASDNDGVVTSVTFHIDGRMVERDSSSPYEYSWNTEAETGFRHRIEVVAEDDAGAQTTSTVAVYTNWIYEQPEFVADGWETASLASVGMDPEPLVTLMNVLRDHAEHRIHGILIAVGGRLVLE